MVSTPRSAGSWRRPHQNPQKYVQAPAANPVPRPSERCLKPLQELTEAQLAQNLNAPSWLPGSVLVPGWVRPTFTVEAIACGNGPVSLTIKRCGVSSTSKPDSPHPVSVKDEAIVEASLSVLQQCGEALWLLTTANAPGVQFMQSTWSFRHSGFPALFSVVGTSYVAAPDLRHETPGELKAQRPGTAPSNARDSAAQGAPTRRPRSAQDLVRLHATYAKELLPSKPSGRAGRLPLARLRAGPQSDVRSKDSFTSEFLERLASTKQGQLLATATSSTGQVHSKGAEGGPILESGSKAWRARLNQPLAYLRADALYSFSLTAHAHPSFKTMFAVMGILLQGRALSWQAAVVALRKGDGFIRQLQRFSAEEVPLARAQAAMDLLPTCTALTPDMAALQHAQAGHLANWTIHAAFWAAAHHGLPPPST